MEKGSSSSSSSSSSAGPDSLNGLKFGKKIYFEGGAPPPPSPAKKGRTGAGQGGQPPRCQVEGCKLDLSDAKAYYSRHKVCGMHSKSPMVIVAGMEQRFCQQCSRFHQLPEFDQGKRSCRRRLAGHNERRRKPSPASLSSPRYGALSPSIYDRTKTGAFVMDFSSCSSLTSRDSWPNPPPEREAPVTGKYNLPLQSNSHNPLSDLLQGTTPDRCFNGVSDSSSALSLLSIQPWGSRPRPTSLGPTMAHPLVDHGPPIPQFAYNHDLGLGQTSRALDNPFAGELELGQPSEGDFDGLDHSRGYDTSLQHMHWSL